VREAVQRHRKGITGSLKTYIEEECNTNDVIPNDVIPNAITPDNRNAQEVIPEVELYQGGNNVIVFEDDSSRLNIDLLNKRRDKLTQLINSLKDNPKFRGYLKDIRFGVYGPTLDRIAQVLEVT